MKRKPGLQDQLPELVVKHYVSSQRIGEYSIKQLKRQLKKIRKLGYLMNNFTHSDSVYWIMGTVLRENQINWNQHI